ncbi:MAG: diadenylate cyclase [Methanospirillaceae archaeon]|nr:diadenylate cyclase [Methanospirillaceae archaeon]
MGRYDAAKEAYLVLLAVDPQFSATEESSNLTHLRGNYTGNRTGSDGIFGISLADPAGISGTILLLLIISGVVLYLNYHKKKAIPGTGIEEESTADTTSHPPVPGGSTNAEALCKAAIQHHNGDPDVIRAVIAIACQIAAEGREGKPVGTAFIVGDSKAVLKRSRQLILNPVLGHPREDLSIANPQMNEYFKELAQLDGAFVISDDGIVEAAGRYISIDTSGVDLPGGLGTRHVSTAAITAVTNALGVVVSESGGGIRIYVDGRDVLENP